MTRPNPISRAGAPACRVSASSSITAVGLVAMRADPQQPRHGRGGSPGGATGNITGAGTEPRIAVGGAVSGLVGAPQRRNRRSDRCGGAVDARLDRRSIPARRARRRTTRSRSTARSAPTGRSSSRSRSTRPSTDGAALLRTYKVKSGDTLVGIASKFHVSMMTVWWANHLKNKNDLKIGQTLTIPPVNGVVVTVAASDTLDTLAAKYHVDAADIIAVNELSDPILVVGQTLTIPGARSAQIPTPKPTKPKPIEAVDLEAGVHAGEVARRRIDPSAVAVHRRQVRLARRRRLHQPVLPLRPLRDRHRRRPRAPR